MATDPTPIRIEGYVLDDVLKAPIEDVLEYVASNTPIVVAIGSSEVLCEFRLDGDTLVAVLAHIDGGGEGVLRAVHRLLSNVAQKLGCTQLRLVVTAVNCADPNLKLRHLLIRLKFVVERTEEYGEAYVLTETFHQS